MPFLQAADGTSLFFREWGQGKPALFLHSWALNASIWDAQIEALAEAGYRAIAFDRRGHGRSDVPGTGYDLDTFSDDVAAIIHALDLEDVTLVGHSLGGAEAIRYLTRHGVQKVGRLVLVAPATPCLLQRDDNPGGLPAAAIATMRDAWREDFPKWVADNAAPFFRPESSPAMIDHVARILLETPLNVALASNRALVEADLRPELASITLPTLIVQGDRDVSVPLPLTGEQTARLLPNARLEIYEGGPHGLMFTDGARLGADLLAMMAGERTT